MSLPPHSCIIRPRDDEPFVLPGDLDHPCHQLLPGTPGLYFLNKRATEVGDWVDQEFDNINIVDVKQTVMPMRR